MCGRIVNLDTVARVLADYYHLKTDAQLAALDEALSRVPAVSVGGGYRKDHVVDPGNMVGDSISRAAVVDAIEGVDWYHINKNGEMVHGANDAEHQAWYKADDIYAAIERVPPAQTGRQKGKWIYHSEIGWGDTWLCDQCGEKTTSTVMGKPRANFCPNCGADMRGEQDG